LLLIATAPLSILYDKAMRMLRLSWSRHLTGELLRHYLEQFGPSGESRTSHHGVIAEDVDKFCELSLELTLEIIQALIHLYYTSGVLFAISPKLGACAIFFAWLTTAIARSVGREMPNLFAREREAEARFASSLTRAREYAQSIQLMGPRAEQAELLRLRSQYDEKHHSASVRQTLRVATESITATLRRLIVQSVPVSLLAMGPARAVTSSNDACAHANYSPGTMSGPNLGELGQATDAFSEILFHLSLLGENLHDFSKYRAVASTLANLIRTIRAAPQISERPVLKTSTITDGSSRSTLPWLEFDNVTIKVGSGNAQELISSLSLKCFAGKGRVGGLLVCGASGVGKSTLVRAIADLRVFGTGTISRPCEAEVAILPQRPYLTHGSLRSQLAHTSHTALEAASAVDDDAALLALLDKVGLSTLVQRLTTEARLSFCNSVLDSCRPWAEELSLGEQQRLAIARLLLSRPRFAILDECTSACDVQTEQRVYELVQATCEGWVSIGHRLSIEMFHGRRLTLLADGHWTIEELTM
jgi:putative ATP-binding cassette transporter